jgi:drug/metabolite transporter (DMT)-like permease
MPIFLFLANTVCYAGQSSLGKLYAAKGGNANSFNLCKAGSAAILFSIWLLCKGQGIHWATLPWAAVYGICLCVSMYAGFQALSCGPMALTSILASMSLIVPFFWGVTFWKESISLLAILGVFLLLCAIILICFKKERKFSIRWLIFSLITMATNGVCSVIQKYHQLSFPGHFQVDFMLFAMTTVTILLLLALPVQKCKLLKPSLLGIGAGSLNGLANFAVLLLASTGNATSLFPMVSVCNVMAAWLTGIVFFREKTKPIQFIGLAIGIIGIFLLNLT